MVGSIGVSDFEHNTLVSRRLMAFPMIVDDL